MGFTEFFRKHVMKFRSDESQRHLPALVGLSVMIVCLILSSLLANVVRDNSNRDRTLQMYSETSNIVRYKNDRIASYRQLLVYSSAMDNIMGGITKENWQAFYNSMSSLQRYSSIVGIGHVVKLTNEQLPAFQQAYQAETGQPVVIHPQTSSPEHFIVAHLAPENAENNPVIGFDMGSEAVRSAAMRKAAEEASPTLTKPLQIVQNTVVGTDEPGLLMYYPLYTTDIPPQTTQERLAALKGFVYVVYRPHDILKNAVSSSVAGDVVKLTLDDVTDDEPVTLYRYQSEEKAAGDLSSMSQLFDAENRTWRISLTMRNTSFSQRYAPTLILTAGFIISLMLGILLYAVLLHRLHKLEAAHKAILQESKDSLLAVASHQLRTPASAVKQYIGMLKQGFVGDLSAEQDQMIEKAYAANERQLEIINQLLYVAKADAGQLFIDRQEAELYEIVQNSIAEVREKAEAKNITIKLTGKKSIRAKVDAHFMSMVIENLLSNAVKYSYPDTTVRVTLASTPAHIELRVKDQGVGVDKQHFDALFEKFSRIENPLSRSEGGSGIGLFLTKRLVEAHGGDITIDSKEGKGSTFIVQLPHLTAKTNNDFLLG